MSQQIPMYFLQRVKVKLPSVLYCTYSADAQSVISGDMVAFDVHWDFSLPPPPTSLSITEEAVMI